LYMPMRKNYSSVRECVKSIQRRISTDYIVNSVTSFIKKGKFL
jgi:hypothetical protein